MLNCSKVAALLQLATVLNFCFSKAASLFPRKNLRAAQDATLAMRKSSMTSFLSLCLASHHWRSEAPAENFSGGGGMRRIHYLLDKIKPYS